MPLFGLSLFCQYTAYSRRSFLFGSVNVLRLSCPPTGPSNRMCQAGPHYLRSNREGRLDSAGSSLSKWLVVPIWPQLSYPPSNPRPMTHQEQSIIVLQSIHLVEEERPVVVVDQRIEVFEDEHTGSFCPGALKDLFDPRLIAGPRWCECEKRIEDL
jgi:hypothetical protein